MAGFVTWLRRQSDRDDSVGTLSRDLIRDDPERDIWTLEGLREQVMVDGACGRRYDAFSEAVVEWGAEMGLSVPTRTAGTDDIVLPKQPALRDVVKAEDGAAQEIQPHITHVGALAEV